jgi:predicted NUDIX family NTP pyrophosphohydrolase
MYRHREHPEVFLIHPGGPFWANKDIGAWTIPKGEYTDDEHPLDAAIREFTEETGFTAPPSDSPAYIELGTIRQPSGKLVTAWAFAGDCDPAALVSNTCEIEWPPRTGRKLEIPEADRGAWFSLSEAHERINKGQQPLLARLSQRLETTSMS